MDWIAAALVAFVWTFVAVALIKRVSNATSLDDESAERPQNPPHVSIILTVRDEERNIEQCVRSMLASTYESFDVLVVDDGSSDSTASIVEEIAKADSRVRIIPNEPLPEGWMGNAWGHLTGSRNTTGDILCFADADTRHGPELLTRSINMMIRRNVDFLSVSCRQVMISVWERLVQPQVLMLFGLRYGGLETVSESKREAGKMAGGPCMIVRREAYEAVGGHAVAKGYIAHDVMLSRGLFRNGSRVMMTLAGRHASVRMYTSLSGLIEGWSKNIILGTRLSASEPGLRDALKNVALLSFPFYQMLPLAALAAALVAGTPTILPIAGMLCAAVVTMFWVVIYRGFGLPLWNALLFGAGALMLAFILVKSLAQGKRFTWKGREYLSR